MAIRLGNDFGNSHIALAGSCHGAFMDAQFKQTLKIFLVLFGVLLFGVLLGISLADIGYVPVASQEQKEILVDLSIDYGNGDTQSFPEEVLLRGSTVFDALQAIERRYGIFLETRNFPGLGVFVEAIHGVHNTNNSYWQFWVNGEYSKVGAGQYVLKDSDKVLWKRTGERSE